MTAARSGRVDAILTFWEAYGDLERSMVSSIFVHVHVRVCVLWLPACLRLCVFMC
jgi:hypothetical protein